MPLGRDAAKRGSRSRHGPGPADGRSESYCSRSALDAIADVLRRADPDGLTEVRGAMGSGIRTLWILAARAARLEGYVPVSARALERRPWLAEALRTRHVALFIESGTQPVRAVAAFIARLGAASARRHVLIKFGRAQPGPGAVPVDRMGWTTMQAMLYRDRDEAVPGGSARGILRTASGSAGRVAGAIPLGHEVADDVSASRARSTVQPPLQTPARAASRQCGPAGCGGARAAGVARASWCRNPALDRAIRALEGRVRPWMRAVRAHLGWILRDRGRNAEAEKRFEHARTLMPDGGGSRQASRSDP